MDDTAKLDILWKMMKGVSSTDEHKEVFNEFYTRSNFVPMNSIWSDSDAIPIPALSPLSTLTLTQEKIIRPCFGANAITLVRVSSDSNAFIAVLNPSFPATGQNIIKNFIPENYHITYMPKIWNEQPGSPSETLSRLFPFEDGFEWTFDYEAGILNFTNAVNPKIESDIIYLEGWLYIGSIGSGDNINSTLNKIITLTYQTPVLEPQQSVNFTLATGSMCIMSSSSVSAQARLECHTTSDYNDTNPYIFISAPNHLVDDGSYVIDGTRYYGERYVNLANLSAINSGVTNWKVTNTGPLATALMVTVTVVNK